MACSCIRSKVSKLPLGTGLGGHPVSPGGTRAPQPSLLTPNRPHPNKGIHRGSSRPFRAKSAAAKPVTAHWEGILNPGLHGKAGRGMAKRGSRRPPSQAIPPVEAPVPPSETSPPARSRRAGIRKVGVADRLVALQILKKGFRCPLMALAVPMPIESEASILDPTSLADDVVV